MANQIEKFLVQKIQSFMSDYLQEFQSSNVSKFELGKNNNIILENLEIRQDLLFKYDIPYRIVDGKINRITIKIPTSFNQIQGEIMIENVEINIKPISEYQDFSSNEQQTEYQMKKNRIKLWEESIKKEFEILSSPNMIENTIRKIILNMSILIKNVTIFFELKKIQYRIFRSVKYMILLSLNSNELNLKSKLARCKNQKLNILQIFHRILTEKFYLHFLIKIQIYFQNFQLYFLLYFKQSTNVLGTESLLTLKLEEMRIDTTDKQFIQQNFQNNLETLFQQTQIFQLSVQLQFGTIKDEKFDLKCQKYDLKYDGKTHSKDIRQRNDQRKSQNIIQDIQSTINQQNQIYKIMKSKKSDQFYILHPIDIQAQSKIQTGNSDQSKPKFFVKLNIRKPLIIVLNRQQKQYLTQLPKHYENQEKIFQNFHLRPTTSVTNNSLKWFQYAVTVTINDIRQSQKNVVESVMIKYINLYKRKQKLIHVPWLQSQWSDDDERMVNYQNNQNLMLTSFNLNLQFQKFEKELTIKDQIKYRQWGINEIRIEAQRYFHTQKDGKDINTLKPISVIWNNIFQNYDQFKAKTINDSIQVQLNLKEKKDMYEVFEHDKTKVVQSFLNNDNNWPNQTMIMFQLEIFQIVFLVTDSIMIDQEILKDFNNGCICEYCKKVRQKKYSQNYSDLQSNQMNSSYNQNFQNQNQEQNDDESIRSFFTAANESIYDQNIFFKDDMKNLHENKVTKDDNVKQQIEKEDLEIDDQYKNKTDSIILMIIIDQLQFQFQKKGNQSVIIGIESKHKTKDKEIIGIEPKYKNKDKDLIEIPFAISQIQIFSPFYFEQLIKSPYQQIPKILKLENQIQYMTKLKTQDNQKSYLQQFYIDICQALLKKNFQLNDQNRLFKNLLHYMKKNNLQHYTTFLIQFSKDSQTKFNVHDLNYENYQQYFKYDDPNFLHFPQQFVDLFEKNEKISHVLEIAEQFIFHVLVKKLIPQFIINEGASFLPQLIVLLQEFRQDKNYQQIINDSQTFNTYMNIKGLQTEYKIMSQNEVKKQKQQSLEQIHFDQSYVKIEIYKPIDINVSAKDICILAKYLSDQNNKSQQDVILDQSQQDLIVLNKCIHDYQGKYNYFHHFLRKTDFSENNHI